MILKEMIATMEKGMRFTQGQRCYYSNSRLYRNFVSWKLRDLAKFKQLVSKLSETCSEEGVITYLKSNDAGNKYILMAKEPYNYFIMSQQYIRSILDEKNYDEF